MLFHNLIPNVSPILCSQGAAAGTGDVNGDAIDATGAYSATFIVPLGAVAAGGVPGLRVELADASAGPWATAIDGNGNQAVEVGTVGDASKMLIIEVHQIRKKFIRVVATRATANVTVTAMIAILHHLTFVPPAKDATYGGSAGRKVFNLRGVA